MTKLVMVTCSRDHSFHSALFGNMNGVYADIRVHACVPLWFSFSADELRTVGGLSENAIVSELINNAKVRKLVVSLNLRDTAGYTDD